MGGCWVLGNVLIYSPPPQKGQNMKDGIRISGIDNEGGEKLRKLNLIQIEVEPIQIQKWSFGMWETSPPAAPLLLKERFDKTLVPLL